MALIVAAISAIGSAFAAGGIFAAGGALSIIGKLLVSTAISLLGRAMADDPKVPGIRNEKTQAGGINAASFILGRYATGGTAVCPEMTYGLGGTTNEYLVYVIDLGDIPGGAGLEKIIIDGVEVTLGTEPENVQNITPAASMGLPGTGDYAGNLWVKFVDGRQTFADPYLHGVFGTYPERPWTSDMIGTGLPHVIVTFRRKPSLFRGYPECRFVAGGIPLYDWRADSTSGGVGGQRWGDPSTWQPSDNPVIQIYNILRGIDFGAGFVWGGGAPASAFRLAEWTVEANKADLPVTLAEGGTEPQFRTGFEVTAFDEPAAIIEELLRSCAGQIADVGGVWRIRLGAPALPIWNFGDDDVMVSSPQDLNPFPSLDATYNAVTATFPDPEANWEPTEAPARYNAAWEVLDQNRRLAADLNLPASPYPNQVQRVMRAYIETERRFASHILTVPPDGSQLEPLDVASWASNANGYDGKAFEVSEIAYDLLGGNAQISLREVDPSDHDWTPGFELPFNRSSNAIVARPAAQVAGAAASGIVLTDAGGAARRPAAKLVWAAVSAGLFKGLRWELRLAGQTERRTGTSQNIADGELVIADAILAATDYQIRAQWVGDLDVQWTPWLAFTTPDARLGTADFAQNIRDALAEAVAVRADVVEEIDAAVATLRSETATAIGTMPTDIAALVTNLSAEVALRVAQGSDAAAGLRGQRDDLRSLVAEVVDAVAHSSAAREELRSSLTAQMGSFGAEFSERIIVLADATSASAVRITDLEATSGSLSANINTVEVALVDGLDAVAALIAQVSVGSAVQFDHAKIWYFDADVDGWTGSPTAPATTAQGWLRPGAASYAASPTGLAIDGQAYAQVRARIRRVGSPTWLGQLWWAASGQSWDAGRRVTASAPTWDSNIAILTINPVWDGVIDAVRFDLATGADASNYYELDWVAVGRPSPGASSAEVASERAARIAGDSAIALDVTNLQGRLTDAERVQTGQADALSGLTTRVTDTEAGIEAEATRIDTLDARVDGVDGVLDGQSTALDQLTAEAFGADGSQIYQAGALRTLTSKLRALEAEGIDGRAAGYQADQLVRDYIATAAQSLNTRVDLTDGQVLLVAAAVTVLQAAIPGLAAADALQALTTTVTQQDGTLTGVAQAVTSLEASLTALDGVVGTKANASAVNDLTATVTGQGATLASQAGSLTALATNISTLAAAITTEATARVDGDQAVADAVQTVSTGLGATNATVTTQATALANVQGRLAARYVVEVAVDGSTAKIEALASADGVGGTLSIITIGSDVFRFEGNFAEFMGAVRIAGGLLVDDTITAAKIVDKSITVPERFFSRQAVDLTTHTAFVTLATLVIDRKAKPVEIEVNCTLSTPGGGEGFIAIEVVRDTFTSVGSMRTASNPKGHAIPVSYRATDFAIGTGPATYTLRARLIDPAQHPNSTNRPQRLTDVYFALTSFVR